MDRIRISKREHKRRKSELLDRADHDGYDGVVLFTATNIQYISGMYHPATERPTVLGLTRDASHIVVPRLEADHALKEAFDHKRVRTYFEYPQGEPMKAVTNMCSDLGLADGNIAADTDGSPARFGYSGPSLSEVVRGEVKVERYVREMRMTKSYEEIDLMRTSSVWAHLGHKQLQDRIEPGRRAITVGQEVQTTGSEQMLDAYGDRYRLMSRYPPMRCKFTTGKTTARPHDLKKNQTIDPGDNVVTLVKPNIGGYSIELERTMFVGSPSTEQQEYFKIAKEAQEIAIDAISPGVPFRDVEERVTRYFDQQGVTEHVQHHIGHSLGLEGHEPPYIDKGFEGEFEPGQVFTVEPGIYIEDIGGFRHSDTLIITEEGNEVLTDYPRSIDQLKILS